MCAGPALLEHAVFDVQTRRCYLGAMRALACIHLSICMHIISLHDGLTPMVIFDAEFVRFKNTFCNE